MNEHEEIAKALKARLSELRTHLAKVDRSLRKPLSADSEDQAIELENQEALEVIEQTDTTEIHQKRRVDLVHHHGRANHDQGNH